VARTYTVVGPNAYIEAPVVFFSPFSEYIYDDGETTYVTLDGEDERAVVTWDETGRLTRLEVFAPDYHEVWTGVLTGRNSDYTHEINGIPRASGHRERDFAWRTTVFDTVIDGVATEEDWTYGSDGATTHYTQVVNGALALESIVTRTPEGVRIEETAGGITNARVQHLDPVSGLIVSVDYDDLDDGFPDRITHVTYDAEGRMTALTQDDGADGVDDQRWEWAYDAFGTEILATWDSDDRNLDPDTTEITTTDAEGRWLTYSYDSEDRGTDPDYTSAQTYDADGHVLTYTNTDGLSRTYAWSGDDMLWFEVDEAGDGFAETRVAFTYETDGTLTTDRTDNDGDQVRESGSDRFTDLAGNIVRRTWYDGDTRIGWLDSWTCETDRDGDSVVGWDDCDDDDDAIGAFDEDQSCPAPE